MEDLELELNELFESDDYLVYLETDTLSSAEMNEYLGDSYEN